MHKGWSVEMFKDTKAAYAFVLPALAFLCLFKIWPIVVSLGSSFTQTTIAGAKCFVGFENYSYLLKEDPRFWASVRITLVYSLVTNLLMMVVSLALALFLNRQARYEGFLRVLCFLPSAISLSVVAVVWGVMLDPHYGLINSFWRLFGLMPQPFLTSPKQALGCLIAVSLWRGAGYWMMFFIAGLQGIPKEIYEAAEIDGARGLNMTTRITLPLLARTISFVLVSNTAFNFLTFAPVFILTGGGPMGSTNTLMYECYKSAFVHVDFGRATAISSILLVVILLISIVELRITKASFEY
jgi:multiple sugar transport system permease protein